MIVAVLHDVLEDTDATVFDLKDLGCTEYQINAISALTKRDNQASEVYLAEVKRYHVSRKAKIADIKDNMDLWRLKNKEDLQEKDFERIKKYMKMLCDLTGM